MEKFSIHYFIVTRFNRLFPLSSHSQIRVENAVTYTLNLAVMLHDAVPVTSEMLHSVREQNV